MDKLPIIDAQNLSIGYSKKQPLIENLTAQIYPGEFIAILGPNGAGKTTLLKTFLGALAPLKGNLKLLNHLPHQDCVGIGYMPQQILRPELSHLTGCTILGATIQAHQWGLPCLSTEQKLEIDLALAKVEASDFADKAFGKCSGGQQRRIMLAQALLGQPKILLLDEPLANLDFRHQEKFIEILTRLSREQSVTILMTTHDINLVANDMTRVVYLAKGKGILGDFAKIFTSEKLSELYQTPMEVVQHQHRFFVVHKETGQVENVCCEHV
jgi:zinc/manganese transport system ATP-binding protein